MEDNNEISGSEINRVENLERIVRRFRIAVAGGTVIGGFGKLPKNNESLPLPERLANIRQARSQFNLSGQGVDVAGRFEDGISFS